MTMACAHSAAYLLPAHTVSTSISACRRGYPFRASTENDRRAPILIQNLAAYRKSKRLFTYGLQDEPGAIQFNFNAEIDPDPPSLCGSWRSSAGIEFIS